MLTEIGIKTQVKSKTGHENTVQEATKDNEF